MKTRLLYLQKQLKSKQINSFQRIFFVQIDKYLPILLGLSWLLIALGAGIGGLVAGVGLLDKVLVTRECSALSTLFSLDFESWILSITVLDSDFLSLLDAPQLSLFWNTSDAGILNVLSDLSNSLGEDDGEQIDLLIDGCDDSVEDGGAEFLLNNGLNLFRDFGLGDRSQLFNDLLFGLGVRLNRRLKLALKLKFENKLW